MRNQSQTPPNAWQIDFMQMLPTIERQLRFHFRDRQGDDLDDAVQEGIVNALCAYR